MRDYRCLQCGRTFAAHRSTARFCSDRCRKRASRSDDAAIPVLRAPGPVEDAARRQLDAAGNLDTALGNAALAMARKIDLPSGSNSGLAALVTRFFALMPEAMKQEPRT